MDEETIFRRMARRCALLVVAFTSLTVIVGVALLLVGWGRNQGFTPEYVEQRIGRGMSVDEVEKALGLPSASSEDVLFVADNTEYRRITRSGSIGIWFAPQHDIVLRFDGSGRLVDGYAKITWRLDEVVRELRLDGRWARETDLKPTPE